jgi:hypothetical protein
VRLNHRFSVSTPLALVPFISRSVPEAEGSSAAEPNFRFRPPGPRAFGTYRVVLFVLSLLLVCAPLSVGTLRVPPEGECET